MLRRLCRYKVQPNNTGLITQMTCSYTTENNDKDQFAKSIEPFKETSENDTNTLGKRLMKHFTFWKEEFKPVIDDYQVPNQSDVIIIGGGAIGSSIAYWLKRRVFKDFSVLVVEKDPTYSQASTALSVGGLRQQFSLKENIEMSLYGAEFLRTINDHLGVEGNPPIDINFRPHGYLLLASEASAEDLQANSKLQNSLGAKNKILTRSQLNSMFPWLHTDDVALGCLGLDKEGWFDPWLLLCAFKNKAISLGVKYVHAEPIEFVKQDRDDFNLSHLDAADLNIQDRMKYVIIKTASGKEFQIRCAAVVIAAGAFSAEVAKLAQIGTGSGLLSQALPVEPRKRFVYCFHCPNGPGINTPLTIDSSGTYFRREGLAENYICGRSPDIDEEPDIKNLDVDHDYFDNTVWPLLAHRAKAFENIKVKSSWAGYYEYNTFDENGIVGFHPAYSNLLIATGFSGHGIQHAPAVGRAIAELILDSSFTTLDLSRLCFDRFIDQQPIKEINIV